VKNPIPASLLGIFIVAICAPGVVAQSIHEREINIPWALAGHNGLDALLVYAELPGKHPLPEITPPNVAPPAGLSRKGLEAFKDYLLLGPHKAFATSQHAFGFSTARRTVEEAREKAMENCKHATQDGAACAVVSVDNAEVR
jgi:hypothetical protein